MVFPQADHWNWCGISPTDHSNCCGVSPADHWNWCGISPTDYSNCCGISPADHWNWCGISPTDHSNCCCGFSSAKQHVGTNASLRVMGLWCVTVFYHPTTWATTHHLQRIYLPFWEVEAVLSWLKISPHTSTAHNILPWPWGVFLLRSMCRNIWLQWTFWFQSTRIKEPVYSVTSQDETMGNILQ